MFVKLLFSAEIYDELAQEFQQQADAKRAANGLSARIIQSIPMAFL